MNMAGKFQQKILLLIFWFNSLDKIIRKKQQLSYRIINSRLDIDKFPIYSRVPNNRGVWNNRGEGGLKMSPKTNNRGVGGLERLWKG